MQALLLVDHGSRAQASNAQLGELAAVVRRHLPVSVELAWAHMELAEPSIEQAINELVRRGISQVVVVPHMLAPGRHATEDVPRLARAAAERHPGLRVSVSECLGVDDLLAQLIVRRATAAGLRLHDVELGPPKV